MANNQITLNKVANSCPIVDLVALSGMMNGSLMQLGTQNTDGTYNCSTPTAITNLELVLTLAVPLSYEANKDQNDFTIAAGDIVRAYVPYIGMVVSIPVTNLTATATVQRGAFVIPDAGEYKMECVASLGGTESVAFEVDEVFTKAGVSMAKIRCIKA